MTNRTRISFLFYIKKTKLLKSGQAPIFLRITVDNQRAELSIMKSVDPDLWIASNNCADGSKKEGKLINDYLHYIRQQVNNHIAAIRDECKEITAVSIKNSFLGIKTDEKKIVEIFEDHNKKVKLLVGKDFAPATLQRYDTCKLHLQNYIRKNYNAEDLPVNKIDAEFIKGYEIYLKTQRNCGHNTSVKYIRNFKKIVRLCFGNGWIKNDPFTDIRLRLKKVDKGFLTDEEIKLITKKDFSCERLQQVADVFLFGCYTGYAYSDLKRLTRANIVKTDDGQTWIHAKRLKTDVESHVPMLSTALGILEKYRNHSYCVKHNVLLPVLSNQKLNAYLKEIADVCGITKNISTHMARHTFATTVTLNNDIPIESVSKMLGHSSIKMTQIYARLLDKKVGRDMNKLQEKFTLELKE